MSNSNIEVVNYKRFSNRKVRQSYELVGLLQYDWGNSDECLNFTHRATLGGGDNADAD